MNGPKPKNAWGKPGAAAPSPRKPPSKSTDEKFKEAQRKLQEAVLKHVKDYESSEDEDELETENVIGSIFRNYDLNDSKHESVGRTRGFLQEAIVSGASTCLICISTIKRGESIWSCKICYCSFHLLCIQRWSKDTLVQKKNSQSQDSTPFKDTRPVNWCCPKCRGEYPADDFPSEYRCFCGKTLDPAFQSLLAPHSCGETCGKQLKPYCGHGCLLLCHPGPCPPCPKMVKVTCHCGGSPAKTVRCSAKEWSCGAPCNKGLACGKHKCAVGCHPEDCPPCPKKSLQKCRCGGEVQMRDCADPVWQCTKKCQKPYDCDFHKCEHVCHDGPCGDCELSKHRTCPCGKTSFQLPCTEEVPTCGDSCDKTLECGMHVCIDRCHKGKCMTCVETVVKQCRCGLHQREIQCRKSYLCETKCKRLRDCFKHPCNRKCCDGACPPCDKPCGRTLSCKKHTCGSVCHRGPCYPCNLTETVYCRCGNTSTTVPCGKKSRTKPPKCGKVCNIPPECHHKQREPHRCHYGECPPCRQICNKARQSCDHPCPAACHSAVLMRVEAPRASTPWEDTGPEYAKRALDCPDCKVPVPVTCLGEHETSNWPCKVARRASCGRPCGRRLDCSNHVCEKECHGVENAKDAVQAGTNCQQCDRGCSKPRPDGCSHACPKPCHAGACPPCKQASRHRCHCGLTQPYIQCSNWTTSDDRDKLLSCGNQCPKNFPCGHRCRSDCHAGACPNPEQCRKKVKVPCACKRVKKDFSCETVRKGEASVQCDDVCAQKLVEEKQLKDRMNEERRKEEEQRNRREVEKFEKMFHAKKKTRDRKAVEMTDDGGFFGRKSTIFGLIAVVVFGMLIYVFAK